MQEENSRQTLQIQKLTKKVTDSQSIFDEH